MPDHPDRAENTQHEQRGKTSPAEGSERSLQLAAAQFKRSLRADASLAGGAQVQWIFLRKWAEGQGLILPAHYPRPVFSETAEHDVRFDEAACRWFKYTSPGHSWMTVDWNGESSPTMRMASPVEYLTRLSLQNKLFSDDIRLVGLMNDTNSGGWRIVTSQPDVTGDPPTRTEILDGMRVLGFKPMSVLAPNGALAFRRAGHIIWDAHAGNFVMRNGTLVPIDLIITVAKK